MIPALRRAALVILLTGAVAGAAAWVVFFSPLLGVREIEVTGGSAALAERVRAAAGVPTGTPLAAVDLGEVERRVRGVLEVESARVARGWPGTLRISVVERTPIAVIPAGDRVLVVDRFGVVLGRVANAPRLPVLRGGPDPGDPAVRAALSVLHALPPGLAARVAEVRAPSAKSITLRLADGRTVLWGDARHAAQKSRNLASALSKPGTFYDVSSPRVVTVK
ncbi:hypothetical protein TBS_03910 [Thermobispora bispora]|uniref:cell division protein FtsQ/DivIB n=1 Tax=Thermobispora bispora TaxID=2006 RepID=UPI001F1219EA|nr:FtsQ-type POTRA domain-containing protein [Thermobispora bispora]MDI9582379.1 FtsQ-type POTRA domain-containing protein [Thermobispora sp.]